MGRESMPGKAHEVLRTKRLEVVDDLGKVRALIETQNNGVVDLSLRDASGRVRASLEIGEVPDEVSGLRIFDTRGSVRVSMHTHNDPGKETVLSLGGKNSPMAALSLVEEEGSEPYAHLVLLDKDKRGGVVVGGRKTRSFLRFRDHRGEFRTGVELADNGELEVHSFGERRRPGLLDRALERSGFFYRALVLAAVMVIGALAGGWIAGMATSSASEVAQAGSGGLTLGVVASAIVIVGIIAALIVVFVRQRR